MSHRASASGRGSPPVPVGKTLLAMGASAGVLAGCGNICDDAFDLEKSIDAAMARHLATIEKYAPGCR